MAVHSLRWLAAASVWLPVVHSHIAGSEQYNPTSPAETGLAPARVGHLELQQPPAPTPHPRALFQRQSGENTCGFVGEQRVPFTCSANLGAECRVNSAASAIGCCLSTSCNIWTACLPYTSSRLASNRDEDRTMYCSNLDEPECATLVYADGDYSGWTIPLCAATSVVLPIFDITPGSNSGATTGRAGSSGVANPTDGVASPTDSVNDNNNGNNRDLDTSNSNNGNNKTPEEAVASTVNVALIVGAVVGGVGFIAMVGIIIFLIIYCGRRKKRNQEQLGLQSTGAPQNLGPQQQQQQMSTIGPNPTTGSTPPPGQFMGTYPVVDNRPNSMMKPAVQDSVAPMASHITPTGTPALGYNAVVGQQQQQYDSPQQGYGVVSSPPLPVSPQFTGQPVSPQFTGNTNQPVSPQATGYGMYGNQQQQQYQQPQQQPQQGGGYYPNHAVELSTQRGDGQVHEVQ
ncbi:hypothetical protein B0T21DRAFT_407822 [Apiosordaria backusii]|uniref:Uncharacterized protein n=1 Tax=Apiosordaria backusii TaxID=314023 RepID=A0AA40ESQ2_9PEZI|nr:hypothetical protein B0T21DRAFT_407822 [Apiosordaria backusii]